MDFEGRRLVGWRERDDWGHKNKIVSESFKPS